MSVIDKKGRIFGKLNIIDLIAILLIVAVLALIGYKLLGSDEGLAGSGQSVVYTVEVKGVEPEVYDFIQDNLPSQLTASNEMLDAYVTAAEGTLIEEDIYSLEAGSGTSGEKIIRAEAGTYDVVFTIEGTVKDNLSSKLGTQEIRVGKSHIVKTTLFELEGGVITSCERIVAQ
ncbi:DUF4330 domain-containing protein [Evtepia sp.]